jgi:hypothetical protein
MPFIDDRTRPTGDIFEDQRRRLESPSRTSTTGASYPRTSAQQGPKGFGAVVPTGQRSAVTSTGTIHSDRAAQSHTQPRLFSRASMGVDHATGQTRRYAGTVNIGAGDQRRTLGFRTNRDFEKAQRAVSERNRRVQGIRKDAARRGISLKEEQDMNNNRSGLSLGEKVLQQAGTRLEAGEKRDPNANAAWPRGMGRSKAGRLIEAMESDREIVSRGKRGLAGIGVGGAAGAGTGALVLRSARGRGALLGTLGGAILGSRTADNISDSRTLNRLGAASAGRKSAETDSFGSMVISEARQRLLE